MASYIILGFLCVIQSSCLSILPDGETKNGTIRDESGDSKTDVFRQLLNQETLIRMTLDTNVHSLRKDMIEMKESMSVNNKRLHDAEKEISILQNEVQLLKTENQKLKEQAVKFQEEFKTTERRFDEIEGNFSEVSFSRAEYERVLNKKFDYFEKNTSTILNDIKIEVRYLSVTLLNLNKHTMEINGSFSNLIESKFTEYSTIVKRSINDINNKLLTSTDFQEQLVYNLSALGNDQSRLMNKISALKTKIGFTAGMTSFSTTWAGNTLVFPHVVTNNGDGYNSSTGTFIAPKDGTYVFFVTVNPYENHALYLDIVQNGVSKVRSMSHGSSKHQTGANMAVLQLDKGDSVWVRRYTGRSYYSYNVPVTTFSGFLL